VGRLVRIALWLFLVAVVLAAAWLLIIPANTFLIFRRPGGGSVSVSRSSVEFLLNRPGFPRDSVN
jgi:hypothetical protein